MLFLPREASKRLRGAMRCGFLSLSPVLGAGMLMRLEENFEARQAAGKGFVGVAATPLHMNPASNSWSAVRGTPKAFTMLMAGWPPSVVEDARHGLLGSEM